MAYRAVPVAVLICIIYLSGSLVDCLPARTPLRTDISNLANKAAKRGDGVLIDDPSFIPIGSAASNPVYSYSSVFNGMNKDSADLILYPYAFTSSAGKAYTEGAVIQTDAYAANMGLSKTNVTTAQAMALYDNNIGILNVVVPNSNASDPAWTATYETYDYCVMLYDYVVGKYPGCWGSGAQFLSSGAVNSAGGQIVQLSPADISSGILLNGQTLQFSVLIFPDIYQSDEELIADMLNVTALTAFLNLGGTIYSSGKGALVLQVLGLVASGTFDSTNNLVASSFMNPVLDCSSASAVNPPSSNWASRVLCMAPPINSNGQIYDSLTSAPLVLSASDMTVLTNWDPSTGGLTILSNAGATSPASTSGSYPHTLYKAYGQGQIITTLGNPVWQSSTYGWIFDAILLSLAKPLILEGILRSNYSVIPAYEPVVLTIDMTVINLYTDALTSPTFTVWIASGVEVISMPTPGCSYVYKAQAVPNPYLNASFHLDCSGLFGGSIPSFETLTVAIVVKIFDTYITAKQSNIVILYPYLTYVEPSRDNEVQILNNGPITVNAAYAAALVADVNADPMAIYPIVGAGNPVDNVPYVINKEDTQALEVSYISNLPLVSAIVDTNVQTYVSPTLVFDALYYQERINLVANYKYPFTSTQPRDIDWLDYYLIALRGNYFASDYDEPIKSFTINRNATFPTGTELGVGSNTPAVLSINSTQNLWYSKTVTTSNVVVQEDCFTDASNFYEMAGARSLAYLDPSTPHGYEMLKDASMYVSASDTDFPKWMKNSAGDALRTELIFGRMDIYFYDVGEQVYANPTGIVPGTVISIDRYQVSGPCVSGGGSIVGARAVNGYFDSTITTNQGDWDSFPGMKFNEYTNGLLTDCYYANNRLNASDVDAATGGSIQYSHYIERLSANTNIKSGGDVMYFMSDDAQGDWYYAPSSMEGVARFGDYPEVRIQNVYACDWLIDANQTEVGGRFAFQFSSPLTFKSDPLANEWITVAADKVAVTGITWDASTSTITVDFKRGQEPDEYDGAASTMGINLQWVSSTTADTIPDVTYTLFEMNYDISSPQTDYEVYTALPDETQTVIFYQVLALQLPSIRINHALHRGPDQNESYIQPYETLEPYVRQGTFMQELKAHRTVYSSAQLGQISDTGVTLNGGGFDYVTTLGISSIPFQEYLTTGAAQWIPSVFSTSRVAWKDLWGRSWCEPVRSVFVDIAPLPGPLRDFEITTTFELLVPGTNERVQEWQSDTDLIIHAQAKVRNNYYKYFDMTLCNENMVLSTLNGAAVDTAHPDLNAMSWNGGSDFYGLCFMGTPSWMGGVELTPTQQTDINQMHLCADDQTFYAGCNGIANVSLPNLSIRPNSDESTTWNYAQNVFDFYPTGYIEPNMWDLTCPTYELSEYVIANPFHMDNWLPSFDTGLKKPQNIISFPILKGLGYNSNYYKTLSHPKFPGYSGWWSDQLQNRDTTLMAGQQTSSLYAVNQPDLTAAVGWEPINELEDIDATAALGNIYTCLFNRMRIRTDPNNTKYSFSTNVVVNNIMPVDPTLINTENTLDPSLTVSIDPRYSDFDCDLTSPMYMPDTISQFDNLLITNTDQNYLYFAANLRAQALENINVLYTLGPDDSTEFEGIVNVQNGPRFVYWNPALGPNTFEVVDDEASTVYAKRTDLTETVTVYPTSVSTFNAIVIEWIHIQDTNEIGRQWTDLVYNNFYGYGDSAVQMYVGGVDASTCIVNEGGMTYVTITFQNNAGFDWSMYGNAIEFTETESTRVVSGYELMSGTYHSIQVPTAYNFLILNIPEYLQPYVTLTPSSFFSDVPPMVFDFQSNNVVSIIDGFDGSFYYDLQVHADSNGNFPASIQGRLHEINVTLNQSCFNMLPGFNDPVGHDYTLAIPNIVFAIPWQSGEFDGDIFWVSGHANNIILAHTINPLFTPTSAYFINRDAPNGDPIDALASAAGDAQNRIPLMKQFWNDIETDGISRPVGLWYTDVGNNRIMYYNVTQYSTYFPWDNQNPVNGPAIAEMDLLVYCDVHQMQYGANTVVYNSGGTFQDDTNKTKSFGWNGPISVYATGAWLTLKYTNEVYYNNENNQLYDSNNLHEADSGMANVTILITNTGSDIAYYVNITLILGAGISQGGPITYLNMTTELNGQNLTIFTGLSLVPGAPLSLTVPLSFTGLQNASATSRVFVDYATSEMDLTSTHDADNVLEYLNQALIMPLVDTTASLVGVPNGNLINLTVNSSAIPINYDVFYVYWRRNSFAENGTIADEWYIVRDRTKDITIMDSCNVSIFVVDYQVTVYGADNAQYVIATTNVVVWQKSAAPWWLPLAIALPLGIALLAAIAGAFYYARKNKPEWFAANPNKKPRKVSAPKAKAPPTPNRSKAPSLSAQAAAPGVSDAPVGLAAAAVVPDDDPYNRKPKKEYTVNIDYIMTGAKGVRVREGNPTSPEPPTGYETDPEDFNDLPNHDDYNNDEEEDGNYSPRAPARQPRNPTPGKSWRKAVRNKLKQIFFCF